MEPKSASLKKSKQLTDDKNQKFKDKRRRSDMYQQQAILDKLNLHEIAEETNDPPQRARFMKTNSFQGNRPGTPEFKNDLDDVYENEEEKLNQQSIFRQLEKDVQELDSD